MYKLWILFFIFSNIFISCNRNKIIDLQENIIEQEIIIENENEIESILDHEFSVNYRKLDINPYEEGFQKIMYVTSKEGLRKRSEPSINGEITGLLYYGETVVTYEKSDTVDTIDGITDYWYRVWYNVNNNEWIFGGYISEYFPSDLPNILGYWINSDNDREAVNILPDNKFIHAPRIETSNVRWGQWELDGAIIKIYNLAHGDSFIGIKKDTEDILLEIIDNNLIILKFQDRIVEFRRYNELKLSQ